MCTGSEAVEAAVKLAYQHFAELKPESPRTNFISRRGSWHGCTIAALAIGDIKSRKTLFEPLLMQNVSQVSPCHPWRDIREGETVENYVARLKEELENEFQRLGPETVCAFILEPMVGTVSLTVFNFTLFNGCRLNFLPLGFRLRHGSTRVSKCGKGSM